MTAPAGGSVRDTPPILEYKLHRTFKVFKTSNFSQSEYRKYNLVASSPQHGLVFVASTDRRLAVYRVAELLYSKADPSRVTVELPEEPSHIAVNCDGELLAVAGNNKSILIYNVKDFRNQDPSPKLSVPRGSPYCVCDMQWSPSMNETLAIGFADKITILHVGTGKRNDNTDYGSIGCLSWRPSGSGLVVGDYDGTLSVFSPDLSLEESIPAPASLFGSASVWVRAVHWMCNNQFAVIYYKGGGCESAFTLITPEGERPPRAEYVGRLESDLDCPRYSLLQIKPWNVMLCAPMTAVIKLLPPDSDGGNSQAPFQLVSELLREDDLYPVGVALDRVPVLRQSSQSHLHEPTDETVTLLHVLTQMGDLATYTVGERPSTPRVDTESSRTPPCSEPAALEPSSIYSKKQPAECAAPAAEHEGGARARAARRLDETALARLSLAQDPPLASTGEQSPGGAPASFCGPCAALVGPAERKRHARSLPHRASVFAEQELEELVREYVDEQVLALLGPPAGAASQDNDSLVELSDAPGWYRCALCELRVPRGARCVHERGRRHGACAALAHAALRRAATRLRRPGPLCGARVSDRGLHTLLQLYCGEQDHGTDGEPGEAEGDHDQPEADHLHNVD